MDPLEHAAWVFAHADNYDRQQRYDAAVALAEWGVFSPRHVGLIVGFSHTHVRRLAPGKKDRTGGTFSPEVLAPLLDIRKRVARGEQVEPAEVRAMLHAGTGTSIYFAARLSGLKESWIRKEATR